MKSHHVFWGTLFVTIGLLFLVDNTTSISVDWNFIWNLWPLVLIIFGLSFVVKGTQYRWVISGITALMIGLFLFAGYKSITDFFQPDDFDGGEYNVQYFHHPYSSDLKTASLYVNTGVGNILTKDTTNELILIKTKGNARNYSFENDISNNNINIYLEMEEKHFRFRHGLRNNNIEVKLNPNLVWNMEYNVGVEGINLDLTKFLISDISLKSGVSSFRAKLGDRSDSTRIRIESGLTKVHLLIPKSTGCEIDMHSELTKKNFKGFKKIDSQYYNTENFDSANKKIFIDMKADLSNVCVERY